MLGVLTNTNPSGVMGRKKKKKIDTDQSEGFGGRMADLLKAQGLVDPDAEPSPDAPEATSGQQTTLADTRPVLRLERKGRGGKTVTLVERLDPMDEAALEATAKEIRKSLGCGSTVDGDHIVVQGDQRDRLKSWLHDEGAGGF